MREIKFRQWLSDDKLMFYDIGCMHPSGWIGFSKVNWHDYPIMQFTGLFDRSDKEIYEGDIVKYKYITGFNAEENYLSGADDLGSQGEFIESVEFKDGEFYPRPTGSYPEDGYYAWRYWDFEVIGNIYEHPELLKVSP